MNEYLSASFPKVTGSTWAGLDVAKATFDAGLYFALEPDQVPRRLEEIPVESFPRTPEGARAFLVWADEHQHKHAKIQGLPKPPLLRAVMEATGRYSIELAAWLAQERPELHPAITDPKAAHDFAKSLRMRNITDRMAARALARFGYERKPVAPTPAAAEFTELRELSRQRDFIVQTLVAARNRASEETPSRTVVSIQKQMTRSLEKALERIENVIRKHVEKNSEIARNVEVLQSIPGVGLWTSVVVLAELGDITRFKRSRQLGAFAGLSPHQHDSGSSVHKPAHLCKQGSTRVRQGLYLSALAAIRHDNAMGRFYRNLVQNHKPKMVAIGAVMRKQLILMRSLLISQTRYRDDYRESRHLSNTNAQRACV